MKLHGRLVTPSLIIGVIPHLDITWEEWGSHNERVREVLHAVRLVDVIFFSLRLCSCVHHSRWAHMPVPLQKILVQVGGRP